MTFIYQGPAEVFFSPSDTPELSIVPSAAHTVTLTELAVGTYEVSFLSSPPDESGAYLKIILPDGSAHGGRITSRNGSLMAFLGNVII
ncbi:hypothetical protein [Pseudomonas sp. dw_358]|uniref:hypothetical protein n=1 Tax=Pseudomonas sp. dw_358 TaxID=2720083 RepID=UPI001BD3977C|nr:hypothetical protein [Pseudomonas sp. dw_358]